MGLGFALSLKFWSTEKSADRSNPWLRIGKAFLSKRPEINLAKIK